MKELYPVEFWRCGSCGHAYVLREHAERCCVPLVCACGAQCEKPYTACSACLERRKQEKTETITLSEYLKRWREKWPDIEPFVMTSDDTVEEIGFVDDDDEVTCYGCEPSVLTLDARDILENALQDHHEDAWDGVDESALQKKLDEWLDEGNRITSYIRDEYVVVVP